LSQKHRWHARPVQMRSSGCPRHHYKVDIGAVVVCYYDGYLCSMCYCGTSCGRAISQPTRKDTVGAWWAKNEAYILAKYSIWTRWCTFLVYQSQKILPYLLLNQQKSWRDLSLCSTPQNLTKHSQFHHHGEQEKDRRIPPSNAPLLILVTTESQHLTVSSSFYYCYYYFTHYY